MKQVKWRVILPVLAVALSVTACGGGGGKTTAGTTTGSSSSGTAASGDASASVATFCRDYIAAANAYQQTAGDVSDPNFAQFIGLLTKAQAEAPAAVKSDVTSMLTEAKRVKAASSSAQSVTGDLTAPSQRVSDWGNSHCPNK